MVAIQASTKGVRPSAITVACGLMVLGLALSIWQIWPYMEAIPIMPLWFQAALIGSIVLVVAAIAGLWMMKKWGFYAYVANFALGLIVAWQLESWSVSMFIMPVIIMVVCFNKLGDMT